MGYNGKIISCIFFAMFCIACGKRENCEEKSIYEAIISYSFGSPYVDTSRFWMYKITLVADEPDTVRHLDILVFTVYYNDSILLDELLTCDSNEFAGVLKKHRKTSFNQVSMKKDTSCAKYSVYSIDLTKSSNTVFFNQIFYDKLEEVPTYGFVDNVAILLDPSYDTVLNNGIEIKNAGRIMDWGEFGSWVDSDQTTLRNTMLYDKRRQMIVYGELRSNVGNKMLNYCAIQKIRRISREDFYTFWSEDPETEHNLVPRLYY